MLFYDSCLFTANLNLNHTNENTKHIKLWNIILLQQRQINIQSKIQSDVKLVTWLFNYKLKYLNKINEFI